MKSCVFLVLTIGLVGVIAKPKEQSAPEPEPVPKDSNSEEKSEKNTIHITNNGLADDTAINEIPIDTDKESNYGASIDIFMEENIKKPADVFLDLVNEPNFDSELPIENDDIYTDVLNKDPNEIMDTAAGFVPIPIFRNKQKAKRRFATRRQFRRKPSPRRRIFFFYPTYGFYPYNSFRFY
ncbi:uncharacterized protein [Epargyreus clarus]|uniref:uncharacterized protein n=1 Tax=Epargyreus clarus TaxID=520877 RepID=UPI003C2F9744